MFMADPDEIAKAFHRTGSSWLIVHSSKLTGIVDGGFKEFWSQKFWSQKKSVLSDMSFVIILLFKSL